MLAPILDTGVWLSVETAWTLLRVFTTPCPSWTRLCSKIFRSCRNWRWIISASNEKWNNYSIYASSRGPGVWIGRGQRTALHAAWRWWPWCCCCWRPPSHSSPSTYTPPWTPSSASSDSSASASAGWILDTVAGHHAMSETIMLDNIM